MGIIILTEFIGKRLGNLSALKDFISFLSSVKGDLSNITAPPFILAPQSLTEFPAYWAERPRLFSAPAHESSAERRMLYALEIYLSSLQRQYYIGRPVSEGTKKPLNPFLGELFLAQCQDPEGKSKVKVISEQVSHHPPTTACYLSDETNSVRAEAYSTQYTTLSGTSVVVRQSGHAVLTIDAYKESFLLPFPDVYAKNVLTGSPYPELQGTYKLYSTSGFTAEVKFGGKSKLLGGGERNVFEASIHRTSDHSKQKIYEVSGSWSDRWTVKDGNSKEISAFDLSDPKNKPAPILVAPLEKQSPWESRRAWKGVAKPLEEGDYNTALSAKSELENGQRAMRKKEKAEGTTWTAAFFDKVDVEDAKSDPSGALSRLLKSVGDKDDVKNILGSHGCWRFNHEKARKWRDNLSPASRPETPMG